MQRKYFSIESTQRSHIIAFAQLHTAIQIIKLLAHKTTASVYGKATTPFPTPPLVNIYQANQRKVRDRRNYPSLCICAPFIADLPEGRAKLPCGPVTESKI
jgi:hypothetical protein